MAKKAAKKATAKKATAKRTSAKKASAKKASAKRELISPRGAARYAKRRASGEFSEMDDVGRSQAADRRRSARTVVEPGFGDQGDQTRPARAAKKR